METNQNKWNYKKIIWGVVSFFIPLIGLIFFFVKKKEDLSLAKFVLYCAIAGFALNMINYCNSSSDDSDTEYYESSSTNNYNSSSSSSMSSNSISANFRTETDVRTFLCRYTFRDNEGNRISFSNMANQLEMNGRAMSSSLTIQSFGHNEAELVFQGPYGRSRFYLAVEDGEAGLMDRNDLSTYYAK